MELAEEQVVRGGTIVLIYEKITNAGSITVNGGSGGGGGAKGEGATDPYDGYPGEAGDAGTTGHIIYLPTN